MNISFKNPQDKYRIMPNVFNGAFMWKVIGEGSMTNRLTDDIKLDIFGIDILSKLILEITKEQGEKTKAMTLSSWNQDSKSRVFAGMIGIRRDKNNIYHIQIEVPQGGENKVYSAPITLPVFPYKIGMSDNEIGPEEASKRAIESLYNYLTKQVGVEMAISEANKNQYHQTTTLNNVADKVGAEKSVPRSQQGGGNSNFKKPYKPASSTPPASTGPIDDDIPF